MASRDVQKAFDTVWHRGLLYKISHIPGIDLDFTTLIKNFLDMRKIAPVFHGVTGSLIIPTAGVPQGSSLGPILFNVYVNDHPQPIFSDTILLQFADDMTHIVCSDSSGKFKTKQAITKMQLELENTLQWERNWKIQSNPDKCKIQYMGTTKENIGKFGGIRIENKDIQLTKDNKLLGAIINNLSYGTTFTNSLIKKAKISLSKLIRFQSAPSRVKLTLYKTLIRPVLEYPYFLSRHISHNNRINLQKMQNNSILFVENIRRNDRKRMSEVHDNLKLDALNVHVDKLCNKMINKMREIHYLPKREPRSITYKYSDYSIQVPPIRTRRKSIPQHMDKYLFQPRNQRNKIKDEPSIDNWKAPTPIYSSTKPSNNNNV